MHNNTHQPIVVALEGAVPQIDQTAFLAPGCAVTGDVRIGADASVWYGASLRGDYVPITVGARSNIQDNATLHADPGFSCVIHDDVTIGHNAVVHGATVESGSIIGMGAVVMNGAVIGAGSLVAGGAVVMPGTRVPAGSLLAGTPAKVRRPTTAEEQAQFLDGAATYVRNAQRHRNAQAHQQQATES